MCFSKKQACCWPEWCHFVVSHNLYLIEDPIILNYKKKRISWFDGIKTRGCLHFIVEFIASIIIYEKKSAIPRCDKNIIYLVKKPLSHNERFPIGWEYFSFEKLCNAIPNLAKIRSVRRGSQAGCII